MRWRKYIDFDVIHLLVGAIVGMGLSSCQPEMPVISTITVEADGLTVPVNPDLYGLTIEEINHGIDGGAVRRADPEPELRGWRATLELSLRRRPERLDYPEWMDDPFHAGRFRTGMEADRP